MSSSSDSACSTSSISESETINSSSEVVGVSSSLQRDASLETVLEATLDDSISEGDWETGFIFLPEIIFWKMILGESMRAKGKDFSWEKRGMNLEICHFI